ncbi:protein tweety-like protein [Leptotrombidium deliense]|uniref:Protein tweety homolog n=1 Tax=Leptotrombidium deliense TaxID=299467 RepID=A0A443SU98_9ACAR|nr:protein tweety-like protein [Leptotrombidium deliense]
MFSVVDYVLNATVLSPDGKYNVSMVAQWFHRIPHLDIRLNWVNSTFDPSDNEYLEALGILVAVPGFWLILTLLFFLIFFLCRCCDVNSKKKKKLTCCKCCLFMFTLITTTAIGVGFYGNYQSHEGIVEVQNSTSHLEVNHLNWLRNKSQTAEILCDTGIESKLNSLSSSLVGPLVKNYSVVNVLSDHILAMKRNTTKCVNIMGDVNRKLASLDISYIPRTIKEGEQFRWPITMAIFAFLVFICLVLFCGICRHSRCLLILFSVLGLLSLVVCWVMTSLLLGTSVAGADFCMDPKPFLRKQYSSTGETILINYYLNCDVQDRNPLATSIEDMRQNVGVLQSHIFDVSRICDEYCHERIVKDDINAVKSHITKIEELLSDIEEMSKCSHIHEEYIKIMSYSCKDALEGVALMLASTSATGLLLTLLVLCASHTWINIRKKRAVVGDTAEETDPFLPPTSASSTVSSANSKRMRDNFSTSSSSTRPRYSHTPPQTPHFPSSGPISTSTPTPINGRSINREDQLSFLTPPPSYEQVGQHPQHHPQHPHPHLPQLHGQHHQAVGPHYVVSYRK